MSSIPKAHIAFAIALALALALGGAKAQAPGWIPMTTTFNSFNTMALNQQMAQSALSQSISNNALRLSIEQNAGRRAAPVAVRSDVPPPQARSTLISPSTKSTGMPKRLAQVYDASHRAQAQKVFEEVLDAYQKIESQFGIPRYDLAGAVAAFVAGNYMAYRDVDFPDENFIPLVNQMRKVIESNPGFGRASEVEKQEMYEQMAILGTYMALTRDALKQQPSPQIATNMRQAAKGYLEQFLKTDADRMEITPQGLVIR